LAAEIKTGTNCRACDAILALTPEQWEQLEPLAPLRGEGDGRLSIAALARVLEVSDTTTKRHVNSRHVVR